jgi:hypothetical protein
MHENLILYEKWMLKRSVNRQRSIHTCVSLPATIPTYPRYCSNRILLKPWSRLYQVPAARLRVRAGWKQTTENNKHTVLCRSNRGNLYKKSSVVVSEAGVSRVCSGRGSFHRKIQVKSSQVSSVDNIDSIRGVSRPCSRPRECVRVAGFKPYASYSSKTPYLQLTYSSYGTSSSIQITSINLEINLSINRTRNDRASHGGLRLLARGRCSCG